LRADARIRVHIPLQSCLGSRSKAKTMTPVPRMRETTYPYFPCYGLPFLKSPF